ncbi:hypothetical protein G6O69_27015 [Pseudenhygromyxa sp. WMMC2535]|uniref:hypothetical protein n=1 Tax=Pseudenhygromyxa sp. WMMC2535 TaxID=2712867 RepID=UPI001551919D|nr:hypothetical protein [Pseudenhygromyxa sp. WMMC2535]NVB41519.1 hypothetical protein [Pseudenhygromyxa sp. WMMC2535]
MRRWPIDTLLALSLIGCADAPAEVVIDTRVGESFRAKQEAPSPAAIAERAALYVEIVETWWAEREDFAPARRATDEQATDKAPELPIDFEPKPPRDQKAFSALVHAVREGAIDELGVPVRNLAEAGPELWPEIQAILSTERERPKREYKHVLGVIGGDVPNRYGYFDLHWKKAHGYSVRLSEDWYEDLLGLPTARISKALRPVYRDVLLTAALLRASAKIAAEQPALVDEIVVTLLDAAYVHDGTFRDEVGRAVDALGDPAIPALLRESFPPEDAKEGSTPERRAEYATVCLDRMDRLHPQRAIDAVSDDRRLLAAVLSAYGVVREGEAAPLLLDFVDADQPGIRAAAREAFEAYVVGPLPRARRKSIRLLGGQTTERKAELSYREHARLAIRERLAAEAPELLEDECDLYMAGGVVDPKCEAQPERLFGVYLERLDERRSARRDQLIGQALSSQDRAAGAATLDTLLTTGEAPTAEEARLFAPHYIAVAEEAAAAGEPARAAQLLRKSAMLLADDEPEQASALTVDALLLEASVTGMDLRGRGMLLATAEDLSPDDPEVAGALAQLELDRAVSGGTLRKRLGLGVLALLASLGVLSFAANRIRRSLSPAAAERAS